MSSSTIQQLYSQATSNAFLCTYLQSIAKLTPAPPAPNNSEQVPAHLITDIHFEISSICVDTTVWSGEHTDALSRILQNDCTLQQRQWLPYGYVNVVAQLFRLLSFDVVATTALVHKVSAQLQTLHDDNLLHSKLKNDIITMLDITITDNVQLAHVFNSASVDVIDLTDLCVEWLMSLYSSHFPEQLFLVTVCNILSTNDTVCLIGVLAGLLRTVIKRRACALSPSDDMYNALCHISKDIKPADMTAIYDTAYKLQYTQTERQRYDMLRQRKDYYRAIGQRSGGVPFQSNIGDPSAACHTADAIAAPATSPPTAAKRFVYNSQNQSTDGAKLVINTSEPSAGGVNMVTTVSPIGGRHSRQQSFNHNLDSKLKQQLEAANKQIAALQQQLKEQKEASSVAGSASNTPAVSPSLMPHNRQLSAQPGTHSAHNSVDARVRYLANVTNNAQLQSDKQRSTGKKQPTTPIIKYTDLFDYQRYPCVYMEGYLIKARGVPKDEKLSLFGKRSDGMNAFNDAHRRFFVLIGSFLTYYKTHTARTPTRDECLDMRTCTVSAVDKHELGQWCIRIHNTRETLYMLIAHSQHTRNAWMTVLAHATEGKA